MLDSSIARCSRQTVGCIFFCLLAFGFESCVGAAKYKKLQADKTEHEEILDQKIKDLRSNIAQVKKSEQHLRDEQIKQNTLLSGLLADKINQEEEIRSLKARISRMNDDSESAQSVLNQELQAQNDALRYKEKVLNELIEKFQSQERILKEISSELAQIFSIYEEDELEWYLVHQQLNIVIYNHILFDKNDRMTPTSADVLNKLSAIFLKYPSLFVVVEGHTDNDPIAESTALETSISRATKVANYLLDVGQVNNNQIQAAGKGGFSPRVSNQTAAGRQLNNRIEIHVQFSSQEIFQIIGDQ